MKRPSRTGRVLAPQPLMSMSGSPTRPSSGVAEMIGRALAIWTHPVGAWRWPSRRVRIVLVVGYLAAGYLGMLSSLYVFLTPVQ